MGCRPCKSTPLKQKEVPDLPFKDAPQFKSQRKQTDQTTAQTTSASREISRKGTLLEPATPEQRPRRIYESENLEEIKEIRYPERYKMEISLGKGSMGEVRRVYDTVAKEKRAMKIVPKKGSAEATLNEIEVLKKLDHPNIMKLYDVYEDEYNFYLITEYCSGGELLDCISTSKCLNEEVVAGIMREIFSAVAYCHERRVVHRDLKPENVLFEDTSQDSHIKIIDFGTAAIFRRNQRFSKAIGTAYYVAPEVLEGDYDEKCDVWSCGVILYLILAGYPPFNGNKEVDILAKVIRGKYSFEGKVWQRISEDAKDLVSKLLTYDPNERISAAEALKHNWIQSKGFKKSTQLSEETLDSLKNLKNFQVRSKLQEAALSYIANYMQSKEGIENLRKNFRELDTDGNGLLDRDELIKGYTQSGVSKEDAESITDELLAKVDVNKDGKVNYSEFLMANVEKTQAMNEDSLRMAFNMIDTDKNGIISLEELRAVLNVGDGEDLDEVMQEADTDRDGNISFEEFRELIQRIYKQ